MAEESKDLSLMVPAAVGSCDLMNAVVRKAPPAHYILKIDSYSFLLAILKIKGASFYSTDIFEASGYKWRLYFYPDGDKERYGEGYISLYVSIEDTSALQLGWEIDANVRFFVYDQIRDEYLMFQDTKRLHEINKECGIAQLLDLSYFKNPTNGFLFHDKCVVGVEIFANIYTGVGECLPVPEKFYYNPYTWKINDYSKCANVLYSEVLVRGNHHWKLRLCPKGDFGQEGKCLSLYLELVESEPATRIYADYKFQLKNQESGEDFELTGLDVFSSSTPSWGFSEFLSINDVDDSSKGFLVEDALIIQVEIIHISAVKKFS
ncbi:uncharacterized protein [Coffea arabica]|uniref:MATH domain-containing protein n=1 Tax=Coffea arabica TaxID=13443 RepID=A0ABM4VG88_COFAR